MIVIVADGYEFPPCLFKKISWRQEMWKLQGNGFRSIRHSFVFLSFFVPKSDVAMASQGQGLGETQSVFGFGRSKFKASPVPGADQKTPITCTISIKYQLEIPTSIMYIP